jgi:hypothetical protein
MPLDDDLLIDITGQTLRFRKLAEMAEALGSASSLSVAIRAEQEIKKLHGLIVSTSKAAPLRGVEDLDDGEIDALITSAQG